MKNKWNYALLVFVLCSLVFSYTNFQNREYDWDLPGYVGSLLVSENGAYTKDIHYLTYYLIKKESTVNEYNKIIGKDKNNATSYFYKSYLAFKEQLPYYQIKLGYNLFVKLIHAFGFSAPQSVLLSNAIFYFLSSVLLFIILKKIFPKDIILVILLSSLFLLLPPIRYLSTIASPDMMLVFLIIFFTGLLILKKSQGSIFLVLLLIVVSRPDYIPFALTYYLIYFLINFMNKKRVQFIDFLYPSAILLAYAFILKFYNYPGWDDVFYDSFIHRRSFISKEMSNFNSVQYLQITLHNIIHFKKITLIAIILVSLIFYYTKNLELRIISLFFFVNIYIKFLFFPMSGEIRSYLPFLIGLFIWLIYSFKNREVQNEFKNENRRINHSRNK